MRGSALLLVAVALTGAGTAHASVTATPVSPRTADAVPVELAFDASGRAIASWRGLQSTEPMKQLPRTRWSDGHRAPIGGLGRSCRRP